jgi:hypothetical protein
MGAQAIKPLGHLLSLSDQTILSQVIAIFPHLGELSYGNAIIDVSTTCSSSKIRSYLNIFYGHIFHLLENRVD